MLRNYYLGHHIALIVGLSLGLSFSYNVFSQEKAGTKKVPAESKAAEDEAVATAIHGTAEVDGEVEDAWADAPEVEVKKVCASETTLKESEMATATVKLLWDDEHVYTLWHVKDSKLSHSSADAWAQDSVEFFIDELNEKAGEYQDDDAQYRVSCAGEITGAGKGFKKENITAVAKETDDGYVVEMCVKLSTCKPAAGSQLGVEFQINDDPGKGTRQAVAKWHHLENDSYQSTKDFGTLHLN